MMKRRSLVAAALLTGAMATSASAATFGFDTLADQAKASASAAGAGIEATFDQAQPGGWTVDGITVNATGSVFNGSAHAFLDAGNAGLGVCSSGFDSNGNSNCATGGLGSAQSDDNVTDFEVLELTFSTTVSFVDLLFRNGGHGLASGTIDVASSAYTGLMTVSGGKLSASDIDLLGTGTSFVFAYDNVNDSATQFYVSSIEVAPVPLPASFAFLLAGLGGLGLAKRRHKKTA